MSSEITTQLEQFDRDWIDNAVIGGTFLGGGGGGSPADGRDIGSLAIEYGNPKILPLDAVDDDSLIITVSAVGAPAATERLVKPADYVRAFELIRDRVESQGDSVAGMITNEMGGAATINGFIQSAVTGVPLIDAACNGRAHPTGPMGSMGLDQGHTTIQTGVGGNPEKNLDVEVEIKATLETAADTIRQAAQDAGGLVAVARNPVSADYIRENAAVGVYEQAVEIGWRINAATSGTEAAHAVTDLLDGQTVCHGSVTNVELQTKDGFDVGRVAVDDVELTFWNEYMTAERDGKRISTFPELITVLDGTTGQPITTAEIQSGQDAIVVTVPRKSLSLGAGMKQPELFDPIEGILGKSVTEYAFAEQAE